MAAQNTTASGIERVFACAASAVLPQSERASEWRDRGDTIDGYVRAVLTGTPPSIALEAVDEDARETCRRIEWTKLGGDLERVRCQVAYAIDPVARTARELGVGLGRDYAGVRPGEVPGTDDVEGWRRDGGAIVFRDVKSGYAELSEAKSNGQVRFFATALLLVTGAEEVDGGLAYVRQSGRIVEDAHVFTRLDADLFLDELADGMARVDAEAALLAGGDVPRVSAGAWCRYCPALAWCPEHARLARELVGQLEDLDARVTHLPLADAGRAWVAAKRAEDLLERVLGSLKARAVAEPLPTAPGKVVRPVRFERDDFRPESALALLRARGATEEEIARLYKPAWVEQIKETNDPAAAKPARKRGRAA